jgi:ppGpp synthetase/RelA/SpoT-type nucleotidyltranferase
MATSEASMRFSDYEKNGRQLYDALAQCVRAIIERAVAGREDLPRIQAVQSRAKGVDSLKRKLEKRHLQDDDTIESSIKDLAGVRVIL